jgi:hypothetical protein
MSITRADALTQAKILAQRPGLSIANEHALWDEVLEQLNKVFMLNRAIESYTGITDTIPLQGGVPLETYLFNGLFSAVWGVSLGRFIYRIDLDRYLEFSREKAEIGEPMFYAQDNDVLRLYPADSTGRTYEVRMVKPVGRGLAVSPFTGAWDEPITKLLAHKIALQSGNFVLAGTCDLRNPSASSGLGLLAAIAAWEAFKPDRTGGRVRYWGF